MLRGRVTIRANDARLWGTTTDVTTIDALKLVAKVVFCEVFQSSRRKYRGTGMIKTVSKPLAHLNFLSGVNCYDIGSNANAHIIFPWTISLLRKCSFLQFPSPHPHESIHPCACNTKRKRGETREAGNTSIITSSLN
jgi:hypothetical protein